MDESRRVRNMSNVMRVLMSLCLLVLCTALASAAEPWSTKLDSGVSFYQSTDVGVLDGRRAVAAQGRASG
jgi:hypothetical protein